MKSRLEVEVVEGLPEGLPEGLLEGASKILMQTHLRTAWTKNCYPRNGCSPAAGLAAFPIHHLIGSAGAVQDPQLRQSSVAR